MLVSIAVTCALPCAAQQFWNGTSAGMTKAALNALFRSKLKVESDSVLTLLRSAEVSGHQMISAYSVSGC